jgi:hypothetical protein
MYGIQVQILVVLKDGYQYTVIVKGIKKKNEGLSHQKMCRIRIMGGWKNTGSATMFSLS